MSWLITFDQFKASLLNKSVNFFQKMLLPQTEQ